MGGGCCLTRLKAVGGMPLAYCAYRKGIDAPVRSDRN